MADVTLSQLSPGIPNKSSAIIPYSDGTTTYRTAPSGIVAASPGSVIQVQHYLYETFEGFYNQTSWVQFFSLSFTPRISTSRVLLQSNFMYSGNGGIRLRRGNTELFHPWSSSSPEYAPGGVQEDRPYWLWDYFSDANATAWNNGSQRGTASFNVMDLPNTSSLITYNYDVRAYSSNRGIGFNEHNAKYNNSPGAPSTITIWEIAQ